jgi:UDP-perosamine 4-acetyltransferase
MHRDSSQKCVILGAGGHAAVLIDALVAGGHARPLAALDSDSARWGTTLFDVPIVGSDEHLTELIRQGVNSFLVGVGSTSNTRLRRQLFEMGLSLGLTPVSVRHPTAICSPAAKLGRGVQLLAGSNIGPCASLGDNVLINTGAIIEHDCVVNDHAHVATGAQVAGQVYIGTGAHIGAGSTTIQNTKVGARSIVGAGAVVIDEVPDDVVVVGVPARILRGVRAPHE